MTNNTNIHCAICQGSWDVETGSVVGHPVELHVCGGCFVDSISPELEMRDIPAPSPTDGACLASWFVGDTRIGVPIPE